MALSHRASNTIIDLNFCVPITTFAFASSRIKEDDWMESRLLVFAVQVHYYCIGSNV